MTHDKYPDPNELSDGANGIESEQKALFEDLDKKTGRFVVLQKGEKDSLTGPFYKHGDIELWAIIKVPKNEGQDGFLLLGKHPAQGYFLANQFTDIRQLDQGLDDTIDVAELPLAFGDQPGTKLVVGRAGFELEIPDQKPHQIPSNFATTIYDSFGDETSRQHFSLVINNNNGIDIIDTSSNGTGVFREPESA